ncbi:uncharacterized protein L969DRAFT_94110 [Mixia osmundae IAM 14324]|uniref:Uncharacterized protein n=1 Tax=Mixia osmundae (strain CBS 9802 / IAM 14324 / JCM 22182 / KY 12970) TaxID=764103 RepID=G7E944_MIXOS|nr:uncharacterized protein L969DRAFT_94110 [Mixia osmundae IAM 14324]KEI40297.1 hypothetical protein L969DRAFT_94110 [Mixia osmundae IAM 14324]GAA99662.1 hypothetical protein E5Q_06365 [Mixia osmundae IAM 14324]
MADFTCIFSRLGRTPTVGKSVQNRLGQKKNGARLRSPRSTPDDVSLRRALFAQELIGSACLLASDPPRISPVGEVSSELQPHQPPVSRKLGQALPNISPDELSIHILLVSFTSGSRQAPGWA